MSNIESKEIINPQNLSFKYGTFGGILMAIILFFFSTTGNDFKPYLKLARYLPLFLAILIALKLYKQRIEKDIFIKGIGVGAKLSFIAGLSLVAFNIFIYTVHPEWSFSKYGIDPTSLRKMIMVSAILFFETLVFGNIITFSILQYLKDRFPQ